eukprot:Plantae.Rhodophyta-Purpureofilum_apyrenoidigerum.ctg50709.p1 GENE.Plantae.Rhodophyta-Purpureofilum_apyrenoidigerum.ctg50709~~Plantae.Rhodophyta-Purpureofilum_apyrenoidigerum.ctg50709.p1  ORF type:complete len:280 (-),score=41.30 Plantae.Rhodophyta-Purpureofilum_apyrenoidigerum.ctg50709:84-869(-)
MEEASPVGLLRGNLANVVRIIPTAAAQLILAAFLRHQLVQTEKPSPGRGEEAWWKRHDVLEKVLIAGAAGITASFAFYPLEFIRGRLSVQTVRQEPYSGILHGLYASVRQSGVGVLYRGMLPSALGVFPYVGVSFAAYEQLRPFFPKRPDGSGQPTTSAAIICGAISGMLGQTLAFPFDTCRRRMQVSGFLQGDFKHRLRFRDAWKDLWRAEGVAGFYRGVVPNLIKAAPSTIIAFYVYEFARTRIIIERNLWMKQESEVG